MRARLPGRTRSRRRLAAREPVFGDHHHDASLDVAARAATLGFDFLWLELEHSPITLETVRNIVLATRGLPAVPFARVPVNELWTAKRVLDAGVHGVIFPFTSTAALAQQAVAACRYPPLGRRGSGAGLATSCWPDPQRYYDSADANIVTVAIIEEAPALEQVDAIAATPGLDALFIGTSDLSFSMGFRGRQDEPALDAAIARVRDAARRHGKAVGRPAGQVDDVRRFVAEGFTIFQTATELGFFERGAREFLGPLGRLGGQGGRPLYSIQQPPLLEHGVVHDAPPVRRVDDVDASVAGLERDGIGEVAGSLRDRSAMRIRAVGVARQRRDERRAARHAVVEDEQQPAARELQKIHRRVGVREGRIAAFAPRPAAVPRLGPHQPAVGGRARSRRRDGSRRRGDRARARRRRAECCLWAT